MKNVEALEVVEQGERWGNKLAEIRNVKMVDAAGEEKHFFEKGNRQRYLLVMRLQNSK